MSLPLSSVKTTVVIIAIVLFVICDNTKSQIRSTTIVNAAYSAPHCVYELHAPTTNVKWRFTALAEQKPSKRLSEIAMQVIMSPSALVIGYKFW